MRTLILATAFAISTMLIGGGASGPAYAQKGAKNTCPGGISACIAQCSQRGGQPRLCPSWCQKHKGC